MSFKQMQNPNRTLERTTPNNQFRIISAYFCAMCEILCKFAALKQVNNNKNRQTKEEIKN